MAEHAVANLRAFVGLRAVPDVQIGDRGTLGAPVTTSQELVL